eukprot:CAMPEP_0172306250 /NCGR_PEP_ID=MMETSP1058-20130122/7356_1 /TAXON_ID=83371 /ORGANISM="Detonula confervacea, Strain CCMP 353" /LENGTH=607 /DNA_ID=CAMNT_0013018071 /DNA_START=416 /DNA_END=2239 /DNA_ORIENTATION=+
MTDPSVKNDLQSEEMQLASTGDDGPVRRKRWRRRRKDSTIIPTDIDDYIGSDAIESEIIYEIREDEATETIMDEDGQEQSKSTPKSCPMFSMTFPRYRIDLTASPSKDRTESEQRRIRRVKRGTITKLLTNNSDEKDKEENGNNKSLGGLMSGIFKGVWNEQSRDRKSMDSLYYEEMKQEKFRWISSSSPSAGVEDNTEESADEEFVAAAAFWRMASDVHISQKQNSHQQQEEELCYYLALPDTTGSVAQNLCDILNWYADYLSENNDHTEQGDNTNGGGIIIHADLDSRRSSEDNAIPIVRFTVTTNNKGQHQQQEQEEKTPQQQQEEQQQLLPTAEDTERRTKAWVKRVLVQLGICPFTKSVVRSGQGLRDLGVPVANIMYRHSDAALSSGSVGGGGDVYLLMADAWDAISDMVAAGPTGVSSILLSAPGFDDNFELWAGPIFAMLETCVGAIQAEEMVGIVCFHPQYVTPDGKSWPGFGHMHSVPRLKKWYNQHLPSSPIVITPTSTPIEVEAALAAITQPDLSDDEIAAGGAWQRRTPHAVINVLRAEQLEAAESRRSTGELYERNIRVLVANDIMANMAEGGSGRSVGLEKLAEDLKREQCL